MTPEMIFTALVARNAQDPDNTAAYLDEETNTLWVLVDASKGEMRTFWSPDHMFRYMSDEEISEFIIRTLTQG